MAGPSIAEVVSGRDLVTELVVASYEILDELM
jgi:hypothetical protein